MSHNVGWRLGCQAYSFHHFTFFEAIDKTASLGLTFIEAYPGQHLSLARPELLFHHQLPDREREEVQIKLDAAGVKLVNYGVVGLPNEEEECRRVFDFAQKMGIETIVSEPAVDAFDLVDALCREYDIKVAIHNHPEPSHYWNPDTVVAACRGRSPRLGACADTGHWVRSGVKPLEALKKLEGRIISLHIKDVNRFAPDALDVPWGSGVGEIQAQLDELHRQQIAPVFSIEYELPTADDPRPDIRECIRFFEQVCSAWKND